MKAKRQPILLIALALGALAFAWRPDGALAGEGPAPPGDMKLGGLLYDDWPKLKGVRPGGTHPLYPAGGKKKGPASWRCKECHGWDYLGKDGRYSGGSHYTGIGGILGASGKSAGELRGALGGGIPGHDFSAWLDERDIGALAAFMRRGLVDVRRFISADGTVVGDAENGGALYGAHCAACHGADGNALDFKGKKEGVQGVGWLANDNPQETLHKIRWGHPGSAMPSGVVDGGLSDEETADILKYSQSLE